MPFYSKLNNENKTYDKKNLPIMPGRFSKELFALKKNLTLDEKYRFSIAETPLKLC